MSKQEYMLSKFRLISEFQGGKKLAKEDLERRNNLLTIHNERLRDQNAALKKENAMFSEFFDEA